MKKNRRFFAILLLAHIYCVGLLAVILCCNTCSTHEQRFHQFMESNNIPYTDTGCEFGWDATHSKTNAFNTEEMFNLLND